MRLVYAITQGRGIKIWQRNLPISYVHQHIAWNVNFRFWTLYNFGMTFDLQKAIILNNSRTKHRRCMKLYIFEIIRQDKQFDTFFREIGACFYFLHIWNWTHNVRGGHLRNYTICDISKKCCLCFCSTQLKISQF